MKKLTKENILKVQKERGRGNKNIHVFARKGNNEWVIPAIFGREDYQIVLDWVRDGNEILEPPPKDIDPNRGPCHHVFGSSLVSLKKINQRLLFYRSKRWPNPPPFFTEIILRNQNFGQQGPGDLAILFALLSILLTS
ncbi:MAG: hypothetical protein ACE5E9_01425 [Nitrospinaceae bacterium]